MADLTFLTRHPVLRRLLMPAVAVIAFFVFVLLTFPYDTLARRIEVEVRKGGADLTIGSLGGTGLFGLRARDVTVRLPPSPGGEAAPDLKFARADVIPDLLPLILRRTAFSFALEGYGGTAKGHAALSNDPKAPGLQALKVDAQDFDLKSLPLKELAGVEAIGKLDLKLDVTMTPQEITAGNASLSLENGAIMGGALMGFPMPKTSLGRIEGGAVIEKGVARVEKTSAKGGDIDADLDGNIHLRPMLSLSQGDLHIRFRPTERWLNANEMIKGAIGLIQNARQGDGSYVFTLSGPLTRMSTRPGR